jgi:ChrR Cupin-like domain
MSKPELEFHLPVAAWTPVKGAMTGMWEQMLASDPDTGNYTRLLRFDPGLDTSQVGTRVHDYWEEIFILDGDLTDLELDTTFSAGMYACRPPGMRHGPWRTEHGVLMLEFRYAAAGHQFDEFLG